MKLCQARQPKEWSLAATMLAAITGSSTGARIMNGPQTSAVSPRASVAEIGASTPSCLCLAARHLALGCGRRRDLGERRVREMGMIKREELLHAGFKIAFA